MTIAMKSFALVATLLVSLTDGRQPVPDPKPGPLPGSIGWCDPTKDCDKDIDCAPGLVCADARKPLLKSLGFDERGADCPVEVIAVKPWNWEVCFDPEILVPGGGGGGDPHFHTYDGTRYSFHGQCDLIMARSVDFDNSTGIDVHVRTQMIDNAWSLISNAAIRIGDDTFELVNDDTYYFNGVANVPMPFTIAGKYTISHSVEIMEGVDDKGEKIQESMNVYEIQLVEESKQKIRLQNYRRMIAVIVKAYLPNSSGMLGVHAKKGLIGRDMTTVFTDPNIMGMEWQVQDSDPKLFHDMTHGPQWPEQCYLPASQTSTRRRLRVSDSEMLKAREACLHAESESFDFCVQDVLQTGDVNTAKAYAYGLAF